MTHGTGHLLPALKGDLLDPTLKHEASIFSLDHHNHGDDVVYRHPLALHLAHSRWLGESISSTTPSGKTLRYNTSSLGPGPALS